MEFEELKELIKKSRTTRRFKQNITISPKELEELVDLARITSSAKNMQPLKYIVVTNKELVVKLSENIKWATHLKNWSQSKDEMPSAYILVLNDTKIDGYAPVDLGIALQTIMIGAKAKGYDSAPLASVDKTICKELFSLDDSLDTILAIAIGKADEELILTNTKEDTNYYRDEKDRHCIPKRALEDVLIGKY